ncbi:MAG: type II secretion system minor pseudopilin GspH [Enterobacteriaceae bacterium]
MRRVRQGFTLLEVMLVIIVIGLTASLVIATLPEENNTLDSESNRLVATMNLIQERAVEENRIYGIHLSEHGWQILSLQPDKQSAPGWDSQLIAGSHWQPVYHQGKLLGRQLPAWMSLQVTLEQSTLPLGSSADSSDKETLLPTLLFFPGGELTYFHILMTDSRHNTSVAIALTPQGEIEREASSS